MLLINIWMLFVRLFPLAPLLVQFFIIFERELCRNNVGIVVFKLFPDTGGVNCHMSIFDGGAAALC